MTEIADLLKTPAQTSDLFLVRRGAAEPFTLEAIADLSPDALFAILNEVVAARGERQSLGQRLGAIAQFASPNAGGVVVGNFYDNAFQATAPTTSAGAANRVELMPFCVASRMRIDQIGVACSTLIAAALGKCCIYAGGNDGWPDALLYEGASDLDFGSTGYKAHTIDFTFDGSRMYWLGVRHSSTATLRAVPAAGAMSLGVAGSSGTAYFTAIRRTLAYATPLPASWGFLASELVGGANPTSIRMRAAALA